LEELVVRQVKVHLESPNYHTSGPDRIHLACNPTIVHRERANPATITQRPLQRSLTLQDVLVFHRNWPLSNDPPTFWYWR